MSRSEKTVALITRALKDIEIEIAQHSGEKSVYMNQLELVRSSLEKMEGVVLNSSERAAKADSVTRFGRVIVDGWPLTGEAAALSNAALEAENAYEKWLKNKRG